MPEYIREVVELTDYAVQMRYSGSYSPITHEEYEKALKLADRTLKWVREQIREKEEE